MSSTPTTTPWRRRLFKLLSATVGVLVGLLLAWSGVNDWRFPFLASGSGSSKSSQSSAHMLSADSPVRVQWIDQGDGLEVTWDAMSYPGLDHYSVDIYGLAPLETWYNEGYRFGEELRTSVITYPISKTNEAYSQKSKSTRLTNEETWRICVTGMKAIPGGADVAPYIIPGSTRCSDIFSIP